MTKDSSSKNYIPPRENIIENIYSRISKQITPLFISCKFSANVVTVISGSFGILGATFLLINVPSASLFSFLFINLFVVLDLVDGDLARYFNKSSLFGRWLDLFFDKLIEILFIVFLTISCFTINMDMLVIYIGFILLGAHLSYQYVMIANLYWFDNKSVEKKISNKDNNHVENTSLIRKIIKTIMLHFTLKHSTLFFIGSLFILFNCRYEGLLILSIMAIYSLFITVSWNFLRLRNK